MVICQHLSKTRQQLSTLDVYRWFERWYELHTPKSFGREGSKAWALSLVPHFSLSSPRLAFLMWGDFHAHSRFARSTIPEGKRGTTRSPSKCHVSYLIRVAVSIFPLCWGASRWTGPVPGYLPFIPLFPVWAIQVSCQLQTITFTHLSYTQLALVQCAKKVMSDSPGLVDFPIWLAIFVLNLPDGQVLFWGEIQITEGLINPGNQKGFGG